MKKTLLLTGLYAALSFSSFAQWNPTVGIATNSGGVINMTPGASCDGNLHASAIWNMYALDFNSSFEISFDASFDIFQSQGADGICAVFKSNNSTTSVNGGGGYMGYYNPNLSSPNPDFQNAFGIEFDIFNNAASVNDPSPYTDHIMIARNADYTAPSVIAGAVQTSPTATSVKDATYHNYKIAWDCNRNVLTVAFDNNIRIASAFNYRTIFTDPSNVTWGFTSGIASSCSNQLIKNVIVKPIVTCSCFSSPKLNLQVQGCTVNGSIFVTNNSNVIVIAYDVDWGDGTHDSYTGGGLISHTYAPPATSASITVVVTGYNTFTHTCCNITTGKSVLLNCAGNGPVERSAHNTTDGISVQQGDLQIYPNPAGSMVNISSADVSIRSISVYNLAGQQVTSQNYNGIKNAQINTGNLPDGAYIIEVKDEQGIVHAGRVILKK